LIAITLIVLIPIFITVFASFKTTAEIGMQSPLMPPTRIYLENYITAFTRGHFLIGFKNTMILVVVSIAINSVLGTMTAYALNRFEFKLKKIIFILFMAGMVVPQFISEIGRFVVIKSIGAYNTMFAPIIIYVATDLIQIFIYTQFIEKIPVSLDESAMLDGCSYFGIYWRIIFPLLLPAMAVLGIIKAVNIINDMYVPYLYMPSANLRTMSTTLMDFSSAMFGSWANLSAAIVMVMLPTIVVFVLFQKYIFAGIVAGSVKE
jgi:multiple sugar transport system permease protein